MSDFHSLQKTIISAGTTGRNRTTALNQTVVDVCVAIKASQPLPRKSEGQTLPELQSPEQRKMHSFVVWVLTSSDLHVDYKFELTEAVFHIPLTALQARPLAEFLRRQAVDSGKVDAVIETVDKIFTEVAITQANASSLAGVLHEAAKVGGETPRKIVDMIFTNIGNHTLLSDTSYNALAHLLKIISIRQDSNLHVLGLVQEQFLEAENAQRDVDLMLELLSKIATNHKSRAKVAVTIDEILKVDDSRKGEKPSGGKPLELNYRVVLEDMKRSIEPSVFVVGTDCATPQNEAAIKR